MPPPRPSLAHQASVVTTTLLWTLLSLGAAMLVGSLGDMPFQSSEPPMSFVSRFQPVGIYGLLLAGSTLVPSLLLVRFVRLRRPWHAAILAVIAFVLFLLFSRSRAMEWLYALRIFFPRFGEFPSKLFALYGAIHAAQIATVYCGYRWIGRRLRGGSTLPEAVPAEPPPDEARGAWGGTIGEWRALAVVLSGLALLVVGGLVTVREMQCRQIPAPVWAFLRESRSLEFLTLDESETASERDFHGQAIRHRFSRSTPRARAAIASCLRRSLTGSSYASFSAYPANCAIRVTSATKTYDLLLSFDGRKLMLYEGDTGVGTFVLFEPLDQATIAELAVVRRRLHYLKSTS